MPVIEIEQGWIPGDKLAERLRRARRGGRNSYFRTIKLGAGISRLEIEERTSAAIFNTMWPLTEGKRVTKLRYLVPDGTLTWEIDAFTDRHLFLAEVELDDANIVPRLPRWLARCVVREVTNEPEYTNRAMAR